MSAQQTNERFTAAQGEMLDRMETAANYNAWLLERARPYLHGRVLDAGAGTGTFTERLGKLCDEVVAVEPDPALVPALEKRVGGLPHVRVAVGAVEELGAREPAGSFDAAICFNVREHVREDRATLRVFAGLLRPQGEVDRAVAHERRYARPRLGSLLAKNGYEVVELRHVNPAGALGWLVASRLLRRAQIPKGPLAAFDRAVPLLRALDALRLPFGLSLWAVARRR